MTIFNFINFDKLNINLGQTYAKRCIFPKIFWKSGHITMSRHIVLESIRWQQRAVNSSQQWQHRSCSWLLIWRTAWSTYLSMSTQLGNRTSRVNDVDINKPSSQFTRKREKYIQIRRKVSLPNVCATPNTTQGNTLHCHVHVYRYNSTL